MKKLGIIAAVVVILFAVVIVLTNLSNKSKLEDNPYGKEDLQQKTIDLIGKEEYSNIIVPKDLDAKIASGEPVVAYFFSPDCPYCMEMTPRLMPIADEMDIHVDQLNLLEFDHGWDDYQITNTPTLIYFEDGKEVERMVGAHPNENIRQFFEEVVLK